MAKFHFYLEAQNRLFRERFTQMPNAIQHACRCMCLALEKITIYRVHGNYFENPEENDFQHRKPNRRIKVAELNKDALITRFNDDGSIKRTTIAPKFVLEQLLIENPKEEKACIHS